MVMSDCPSDKLRNPKSGRCVLKTGRVAKAMLLHNLPKDVTNKVMRDLNSDNVAHLAQTSKAMRHVAQEELSRRKRMLTEFERQLNLLYSIHHRWIPIEEVWAPNGHDVFDLEAYDPSATRGPGFYDPKNDRWMLREYEPLLKLGARTDVMDRDSLDDWSVWLQIPYEKNKYIKVEIDVRVITPGQHTSVAVTQGMRLVGDDAFDGKFWSYQLTHDLWEVYSRVQTRWFDEMMWMDDLIGIHYYEG